MEGGLIIDFVEENCKARKEQLSLKMDRHVISTLTLGAHLFLLQDDFLLQHFDGVEFVVGFELGEQDLREGLFVSGLFGK